jgi:hypothetical protein
MTVLLAGRAVIGFLRGPRGLVGAKTGGSGASHRGAFLFPLVSPLARLLG